MNYLNTVLFFFGIFYFFMPIDGPCLSEGLVRLYKKYIPSLTVDKVNEILNEYHKRNCKTDDGSQYHIVEHIQGFTDKYRISRAGLDIKNRVEDRQVYHPSNKPALIYYVCDEHIYFVTDRKTRMSLSRVNDNIKSVSTIIEAEKERKPCKEFSTVDIQEMVDIDEVCQPKLTDKKIVFVSTDNLKDIMKKIFTEKNICCKCKKSNGLIVQLETESHIIMSNPNYRLQISFEETQKLCKSFGILFRNQSITSVAWDIYKMTNKSTTGENRAHKAKNLIDGETLHSYFLKMITNRGNSKKFDKVDYILVDEISMVKELFYRYFYYIKERQLHFLWRFFPAYSCC